MNALNIYLLGAPRVERQDTPIAVDTRKAIALLAYLAIGQASGGQRRDSLATFFWPDADSARAHGALRRTLSALHKALGGAGLKIDRETVSLERGAATWVDVDLFHARLAECRTHGHPADETCESCLPPLLAAAEVYRDDFMAGFSLRDSPAFDDWQFFQVESLRRDLAGALERLGHGLSAQGDFEAGITHVRRWLALDPLHEPAHRQLMQLYAWAGQRAAALRQYREAVRVLEQELSVAPLAETTALYEAIKENRVPPPPARSAPASIAYVASTPKVEREAPGQLPSLTSVSAAPDRPLVGRSTEWATLLASHGAARDGRLVVIEGEAGIGKTRLAESFMAYARRRGARTALARCFDGELNLAYGPFVEGLRGVLDNGAEPPAALPPATLTELGRLLPELLTARPNLPPAAPLDSPGAQGHFFASLRQVLVGALSPKSGAGAPGVLLIDDVQWIDEASLDLLTYLVRRLAGQAWLLLLTWRSEQVPAGHRLRQLLAEAGRAGRATSITLGRWSLADVTELVTQTWASAMVEAGRAPLDTATVARLYQESEGLPFFVIEYLAALSESGGGQAAWSLPGGVRSLLQTRLARVDEAGWQLLSTAAVIGRWFDFDTLHGASGRSDDETVSGLESLMALGLVDEVNSGHGQDQPRYDFLHEKLRSLVYEETSLARRRLLHRRVAEALAGRAKRHSGAQAGAESSLGAMASQIAQHFQQAGREAEAADYFRLAGEHARAVFANAEALGHFRAALALGNPASAALHQAIGDLLTLSGAYEAALASFETAAALCAADELSGIEHKLADIYHRRGDWDLAESHFQAAANALALSTAPSAARARVYADWSLTAHHQGDQARALELANTALALAEAAKDQRALAQAHNILGILASSQGEPIKARQHLERSLELAEALGEPGARAAALNNLALALRAQDDFAQALRLTEQALALSAAQGDRHREAALHNNLADLLHASGQDEAARQHVRQSVTIYAEIGAEVGLLSPEIWKLSEW